MLVEGLTISDVPIVFGKVFHVTREIVLN